MDSRKSNINSNLCTVFSVFKVIKDVFCTIIPPSEKSSSEEPLKAQMSGCKCLTTTAFYFLMCQYFLLHVSVIGSMKWNIFNKHISLSDISMSSSAFAQKGWYEHFSSYLKNQSITFLFIHTADSRVKQRHPEKLKLTSLNDTCVHSRVQTG